MLTGLFGVALFVGFGGFAVGFGGFVVVGGCFVVIMFGHYD
jgi:hypothetical protein